MSDRSGEAEALGTRIAKYLKRAHRHEEQAIVNRKKAADAAEQLRQLVAEVAPGRAANRRPARPVSRPSSKLAEADGHAADHLRKWAFARGADFSFAEAKIFLKTINATTAVLYHLVKRQELQPVIGRRGRYRHVDLLPEETEHADDHGVNGGANRHI